MIAGRRTSCRLAETILRDVREVHRLTGAIPPRLHVGLRWLTCSVGDGIIDCSTVRRPWIQAILPINRVTGVPR